MKIPPSNIKSDEEVLLFPTYARFDDDGGDWQFRLHGKAFEPEASSAKRAAFIAFLRASADYSVGLDDKAIIEDRIRPFLVDNERGKSITVEIAGDRYAAGTSTANGHFSNGCTLDKSSTPGLGDAVRTIEVSAVLADGDSRTFTGRLHLIPSQGVSVISDIDDTIKISQVTDRSELIKNTFLREFRPVEGLPALYTELFNAGVAFHYVSGSPWQLYQPLEAFMSSAGFPLGTFHLKHFRLKDSSALEILSSQKATKLAAITPLLEAFPHRRFILVGDSGEQDPEIYGQVALQHADQIVGIFIRNVTGEERGDDRFSIAFQNVPGDLWTLFEGVPEITATITGLAKR